MTRSSKDAEGFPARTRVALGLLSAMPLSLEETLAQIDSAVSGSAGPILVTPVNATMLHVARTQPVLVNAVAAAQIVTCDGWPVVALVRKTSGRRDVARVTGADLLPHIATKCPYRVLLVGGRGDAASRAIQRLQARGATATLLPPEPTPVEEFADEERRSELVSRITNAGADVVFIGLGIPKQEVLALECLSRADHGVYVCCGASIDFLAGVQKRAPTWMQRSRLEWVWRIISDPKRLAWRYIAAVPELVRASRTAHVIAE